MIRTCSECGFEAENRDDIVGHTCDQNLCELHDLDLPCDDCLYFDGYTAAANEAETLREIEDLKQ